MKRFLVALTCVASPVMGEDLTVYTYDSFAAEWGPGPAIKAGFEAECGCTVTFVTAGDGGALLSRLLLEGASTTADVVVGLDTSLIEKARASGLFKPTSVGATFDLPVDWSDDMFVPFDWGWFAFVHQAGVGFPKTFQDLGASDLKIVIQDPRSSTPGLGLLLWVKAAYGDKAAGVWMGLADNIVTVTPGWSEAYALFLNGEADAVLSYTTSPAYHLIAEGDATKAATEFGEGHYLQVEVAARLAGSDQPDLGQAFLDYLVSEAAQTQIPTTNWMYPAVALKDGLPDGFETLIQPAKSLLMSPAEAEAIREQALAEWRAALSQ
jgi:thiamine transport system substrate-binding protein